MIFLRQNRIIYLFPQQKNVILSHSSRWYFFEKELKIKNLKYDD